MNFKQLYKLYYTKSKNYMFIQTLKSYTKKRLNVYGDKTEKPKKIIVIVIYKYKPSYTNTNQMKNC